MKIFKSYLAGLFIAFGAISYMSCKDGIFIHDIIGAFMFSLGLLAVCA